MNKFNDFERLADIIRAEGDTEKLAQLIESIECDNDEIMTITNLCDEIVNSEPM